MGADPTQEGAVKRGNAARPVLSTAHLAARAAAESWFDNNRTARLPP